MKIAWRNLMKRKFYSLITIFGLSVGITFTLLIGSYVWQELQINENLKNVENQYIIQSKWDKENMGIEITSLSPLAKALKDNYPNLVENYYRFDGVSTVISKGDKVFREDVQLGDSTILKMYGFRLIQGDVRTALNQPNTMVISSDLATKYFGKLDVVGESLRVQSFLGEKRDFMITGVLDKMSPSTITNIFMPKDAKLPVLMSFSNSNFLGRGGFDNWTNPYIGSFIELKKGVKKEDLVKPMAQLLATNASKEISTNLHPYLTSLKDFHQNSNSGTIWTLTIVTLFILLMAIVNFVNISIGNSSTRLKEIGVRKVLGGMKEQVIGQFLTESVIIACFSLGLSLIFYTILRPFFSQILQKEIPSLLHISPYFFPAAILLALVIGLLAGSYPAFVLATLPSVDSMKGKLKSVKENVLFRRLLIASQFSVALFVFGGAAVISQQVSYFFNKDLGYNKASVFSVKVPRDWSDKGVEKMTSIRNSMAQLKEVNQVSLSWELPDGGVGFTSGLYNMGQDSTKAFYAPTLVTDEKYADTYQIPLVAGQFFHAKQGTYQDDRIVLNESAIKALGFKSPAEAVGQNVRLHFFPRPLTIIGVTKNFHFESMYKAIGPIIFLQVQGVKYYRYLSFRVYPTNLNASLSVIEKKWKQLMPDAPFEYTFMDETLKRLYQSEVQLKDASQLATVLAIIIVLLGVLGMVSLNIVRRTKEVGIRKVLGASGISIVMLFMKEFLIVMAIAVVISFPLAILSMSKWLQNYAYRVDISWITFATVGLIFGLVVVMLVSFQTLKAAAINPVKSLKID